MKTLQRGSLVLLRVGSRLLRSKVVDREWQDFGVDPHSALAMATTNGETWSIRQAKPRIMVTNGAGSHAFEIKVGRVDKDDMHGVVLHRRRGLR